MSELTEPTYSQPQPVSLVIVGAGMSGLNALTVARKYLPAPAHEIVIADERADFGGHWNDAYDFFRLHQPYRNYTSFDEDWALKRPPTYLATRDEVLHHFRDVGRRGKPCTLFDHRYIGHSVVNDDLLDVTFERLLTEEKKGDSDTDKVITIRTKRLINAVPILHGTHDALAVSSTRVESIDVRELSTDIARHRNSKIKHETHYVVIGSGKLGMDALNHIHDSRDLARTAVSQGDSPLSSGGASPTATAR